MFNQEEINLLFYRYNGLLSYKALLNMIVGMRGGGKTYGAKQWCIRDFLRNGKQFIWIRRFGSELEESLKGFFNAIRNDLSLIKEFGEITFEVKGNNFYINEQLAGTSFSLRQSVKFKSTEYPEVDKIIFDEFLIEQGSPYYYLKNEVSMLLGLIETIQRLRNDLRVILIANSVSYSNPYFMYFKIKPTNKEYLHLKNRSVVIHFYYNEALAEYKRNTRMGQLIEGSEYEQYAIYNKFNDLNDKFIEGKTRFARYSFTVRYESRDYGFWIDNTTGLMYASEDVDPSCLDKYVLSEKDHDVNYMLIANYKSNHFYQLKQYYNYGMLRFENNLVKSGVGEILMYYK